jgi:hypothetical protein
VTDLVPEKTPKWGKIADLARALGVSERYARKLREGGRLVIGLGGLIDIPASMRLVHATRDPSRGGKTAQYRPLAPPAASPQGVAVEEAPAARLEYVLPYSHPCLLSQRGCLAQAGENRVNCEGWEASDLVMLGFQLGWLARQAVDGDPDRIAAFLRDRDPNLELREELSPRLVEALHKVFGQSPIFAPDGSAS